MNVDEKLELLGNILEAEPIDEIDRDILFQAIGRAFDALAARGEDLEDDKWFADRDLFVRIVKPLIVASWKEIAGDTATVPRWDDGSLMRASLEWHMLHPC